MTTLAGATRAIIRTNIAGTRVQVFSAWAPDGHGNPSHSTVRYIGDALYGRIGTERLPEEIDRLPRSSAERSEAYNAWRQETCREAYELIRRAFLGPDAIDGAFGHDMGEVRWVADIEGSEIRFIEA